MEIDYDSDLDEMKYMVTAISDDEKKYTIHLSKKKNSDQFYPVYGTITLCADKKHTEPLPLGDPMRYWDECDEICEEEADNDSNQ